MADYGFVHADRVFTPNGTIVGVDENEDRNRAIERAELAYWADSPETFAPAYFAFPGEVAARQANTAAGRPNTYRESFYPLRAGAVVQTWLGTVIGAITSARVYRHNFGSRMVAITVTGTNGARYHGRASWDHGSVIRLRRAK